MAMNRDGLSTGHHSICWQLQRTKICRTTARRGEPMQSVEMYFNETIEKYNIFRHAMDTLTLRVHSLTADDINKRCEMLSTMLKELTENKEQFFAILEFSGPGILDTSHIGEFQRALDQSIVAGNALHVEMLNYKRNLTMHFE